MESRRISGSKLGRLLAKRQMSQAQLAVKAKVSPQTISSIFSPGGEKVRRRRETVHAIAKALGVPEGDICIDEEPGASSAARGNYPRLLQPWHNCFEDLLERSVRTWIAPRKSLFDSIEDFVRRTPTGGYWVLEGEPGIGKSTFAAALAHRAAHGEVPSVQHCVVHFNSAPQGITTVRHFVGNIAAQLAEKLSLDLGDVSPTFDQDGQFLAQTIGTAANAMGPADALLVVVDALDEAMSALPGVFNPLYLPSALPDRVYVAVTTRPTTRFSLKAASLESYELVATSEENLADIEYYLSVCAQRPGVRSWCSSQGISKADFVALLRDKSAGNFMYLHYVLPALESGQCQDVHSDALPAGLVGYYRQQYARMRASDPAGFEQTREPLICTLAAASKPLGTNDLVNLTGLPPSAVRRGLLDWREFLHRAPRRGGGYEYSLYHQSFKNFLASEVDPDFAACSAATADRILSRTKKRDAKRQ
jgi:transcriptional regulator with XRE-family HTH domain